MTTRTKKTTNKKADDLLNSRDAVDQFHSTGLLLKERELVLTGEIDESKLDSFLKNLRLLEVKPAPVTIYLHTFGGDVCSAFAMYDYIRTCKSFITIVGSGYLMSAGTLIIQAADDRVCTENTSLLVHDGYTGISGSLSHAAMRSAADWESKLLDRIHTIFAKRMAQSTHKSFEVCRQYLKSKQNTELYMLADEAAQYGIIDRTI